MSQVSLNDLIVPSREVEFDFPGLEGFKVKLCHTSRETMSSERQKCLKKVLNKKTRAYESELDEDAFLQSFIGMTIKGWSGLKFKYMEEFLLVDLSKVDPEDELPFTQENAFSLMKNSSTFDEWVMGTVTDLENFTKSK